MSKVLIRLLAGLVVAIAAVGIVFVVGMRRKSPPVLNTVRRIGRATKPLVLRSAGTEGVPVSVVRHIGRTTGKAYETPVQAVATEDGFVIALPYGRNTDWLQNVLAAGSATIVDGGNTYDVDQPELVPTDTVQRHFNPSDQRAHRWFGVGESLVVHTVADATIEPGTSFV